MQKLTPTQNTLINNISHHFEWYQRMCKGIGNTNWWYSNRSSDDCINIKIYAGVSADQIKEKLSPKMRELLLELDLDIEKHLEFEVWGDYGVIETARQDLEQEIKDRFNVSDFEYVGRSGGWLCVVYNWDSIPSDFDEGLYTTKELREFGHLIDKALAEVEAVDVLVKKRKAELCKYLDNVDNYVDRANDWITDALDFEQGKAKRILSIKLN